MTAVACWFRHDTARDEDGVRVLLTAMRDWGGDRVEIWADDGVAIGVSRLEWQCDPALEGTRLLAQSARAVVASDAGLYGTTDLVAALRAAGITPSGTDPATLILHAWEVWGEACAARLDGDYAFVIWDRVHRRAILSRDIIGRRVLYFRPLLSGVAIASRARVLARCVSPAAPPNLPLVAAALSGLPGGSEQSAFEGVRPVPAGATLCWSRDQGMVEISRYAPPPFQVHASKPFDEAASELRELLQRAVAGSSSPNRTAVWLSGGADSPAIFAAGNAALQAGGAVERLKPVSVSYPEGDPAREDDHIRAVANHWGAAVRWVTADAIPLFQDLERRASVRDDPFAHTFAPVNRALAVSTAQCGAHVALDGHGGDALFEVSNVYLADLLRAGDLREWLRAWRASGLRGWKGAVRWGVLPALPAWTWTAAERVRRRPLARAFHYETAAWLTASAREAVTSRGWDHVDIARAPGEGAAAFESRVGVSGPHFPRALSWTRDSALPAGVEIRSPFLSRPVIEFAASRPVAERGRQENNKRLLKAAMKGLIPDSVLAPRPFKTGVAAGYLHRQFAGHLHRYLREVFGAGAMGSALADHALIDPDRVLRAAERYDAEPQHLTGVTLYLTLEAEFWLRAQ